MQCMIIDFPVPLRLHHMLCPGAISAWIKTNSLNSWAHEPHAVIRQEHLAHGSASIQNSAAASHPCHVRCRTSCSRTGETLLGSRSLTSAPAPSVCQGRSCITRSARPTMWLLRYVRMSSFPTPSFLMSSSLYRAVLSMDAANLPMEPFWHR